MNDTATPRVQWLGMVGACVLAICFAVWVVRKFDLVQAASEIRELELVNAEPVKPQSGVHVTIRAGSVEVKRNWQTTDFSIEVGESVDEAVPAGPVDLEFSMMIDTGLESDAYLGAEIEGCSIIIRNEQTLALVEQSDSRRIVMSKTPIMFQNRWVHLTFNVQADGTTPVYFHPLWQPTGMQNSMRLPIVTNSE